MTSPHVRLRPRRRLAWALSVVSAATILTFVATEAALRFSVPITDVPLYVWDPALGPRRGPNQSGRYVLGEDVDARYHFNSQGWNHAVDYVPAKPRGTLRVCLVGDSYVEALQVDVDASMACVAEARMNRPDRPVQWYPFGCSGWGTTQEYEAIRLYAMDYHPDVVVMLFARNDPLDSSPYLRPIEPWLVTYALDDAGELSLLPPTFWAPSPWRRLAVRSALVRYLVVQRRLLDRASPPAAIGQEPLRAGVRGGRAARVPGIANLSLEERGRKTWELIEKTLQAARDGCRRRHAVLAIAFRGASEEIEATRLGAPPPLPPKEEDPYCLGARGRVMGKERLAPIAQRLGLPYLDLTGPLREWVARTGRSHRFEADGHYNAEAHRVAGEALASWVESLLKDEARTRRAGSLEESEGDVSARARAY